MTVILATQEVKIRLGRLQFEASLGKYFKRPYLKKPIIKNWAGGVAQGEGPEFEFKPHYHTHTHTKSKTGC
jgi:hypothetical protein